MITFDDLYEANWREIESRPLDQERRQMLRLQIRRTEQAIAAATLQGDMIGVEQLREHRRRLIALVDERRKEEDGLMNGKRWQLVQPVTRISSHMFTDVFGFGACRVEFWVSDEDREHFIERLTKAVTKEFGPKAGK